MILDEFATVLDDRTYNIALGGTVLYGLVLNIIMCAALGNSMMRVNPLMLLIGYFVCCLAGILISSKSALSVITWSLFLLDLYFR